MIPTLLTIACLPVAGHSNPYQHLMMDGLNKSPRIRASNGVHDKFFGIARTLLTQRPTYLHFDWISSYYFRRWPWLTYLSVVTFCAQIMLARGMRVRIVWTLHNILPHDSPTLRVHRFCQRFLARRCEWIRVFSPGTMARAAAELGIPESKFRVVPEGDYSHVYANHISQEEARKKLGLPGGAKVFLNIGLIKPYKGILELMDAFDTLQQTSTYLLLAGKVMDQEYGKKIRERLSERVMLVDEFIPADELQVYFNAADVVVLPFQAIENSGSVIMAMGFARPIIAPRTGVVQERLIQQDEWLYDSISELPEKLRYATGISQGTLEAAGNRNFEALAEYAWQDFARFFS